MYVTVKQAAEKWGISDRRVRVLCSEGKIQGVTRMGRSWMIPKDAKKPADARFQSCENIFEMIEKKKKELDSRRPLTEGELERLRGSMPADKAGLWMMQSRDKAFPKNCGRMGKFLS